MAIHSPLFPCLPPLFPKEHRSFHFSSKTSISIPKSSAKLKMRSHEENAKTHQSNSSDNNQFLMIKEEREEMRRKIRKVLETNPDPEEETDPIQRKKKMQKLLADYPLVVDEEDPDWPEDADRPKENETAWTELEKAVKMFWEAALCSTRCIAADAVIEHDLVLALQASIFPEILLTKAGKILHRDRATVFRAAEEWSKIMAFFYYKAIRPPYLSKTAGQSQEKIPSLP